MYACIDGPAIYQFEKIAQQYPSFWYPVLLAVAIAELGRARIGWEDPTGAGGLFKLKDGYEPGNLGWYASNSAHFDVGKLIAFISQGPSWSKA